MFGLLASCTTRDQIKLYTIKIASKTEHPLLEDHCRELVIFDKMDNIIDSINIYCDPGSGCNSYLFDTDSVYTLIDCNGIWYSIDKNTGKISDHNWNWLMEVPENYIGTYIRAEGIYYMLKKEAEIDLSEVYKFKDPGE